MKVLVFGKTGQVGQAMPQAAADLGITLVQVGREVADLSDPVQCGHVIAQTDADAVINAAAWTAVDNAEAHETEAHVVNGDTPTAMAQAAAARQLPFVHISTDYVFSGVAGPPWQPDDTTSPVNAYGRSKRTGEDGVTEAGGKSVILRTSWVFDGAGRNFVTTMQRLAQTHDTLRIVSDQHGGPTPAAAIANACLRIAQTLISGEGRPGIYHFAGAPDVSWADFARALFARIGAQTLVEDIATTDYPTPAARPLNSRLDCTSLRTVFGIDRPDWQAALDQIVQEIAT